MKFLILSFVLVTAALAQYNPQGQRQPEKITAILRQSQDISPEGLYSFSFETENGIAVEESGVPKPVGPKGEPAVVVKGSYSYVDKESGQTYRVDYVADENGYQPVGDHIPPISGSVGIKTAGRF